ncbi:DUF3099 domain-containing protein [Nakamurella antarctica]|uniref:DUF3099 domain-containing protein n=1 Tax=Nakamurella antarctica TaxID=1902245 RepID=A0A3G8ZLH5_9ACTN|nr:DUF3099 domain-containing protein [Nakamurella antarctica]AZI57685.1 DUF3099 domain-containing protein [Nakamurella antarctica]
MRAAKAGRTGDALLITDAPVSYTDQVASRKKRYVIMMLLRIPFLLAAAASYQTLWLSLIFIVASVPLPWMAVLIANDAPAKKNRIRKIVPGTISFERAIAPVYDVVEAIDAADDEPKKTAHS